MTMAMRWSVWIVLAAATPLAWAQEAGDFDIPPVSPLGPSQIQRLRALAAGDADARELARQAAQAAEPLLDIEPTPLEVIHYEGLVHTDPRRLASVAKLRQMADLAVLVRHWQVSGDARAASTLRRLVLAWAGVYRLTGNDVNEDKFYPLLVAYFLLRDDFTPQQRATLDAWVLRLGELHRKAIDKPQLMTNRYTKSVRLLAICGMILGRQDWLDTSRQCVRRFVSESLYDDGSSLDFKRRDTLTYHASSLRPPLELAMLAGAQGRELYAWQSPKGGSLKKSVDFVVPYAMGEKTREEWVNSKVPLDRRRAEAGLDQYRRGRLYEPRQALALMEQASYFDPDLLRVVYHLTGSQAKRFPTWQTLIHEAARTAPAAAPATGPTSRPAAATTPAAGGPGPESRPCG